MPPDPLILFRTLSENADVGAVMTSPLFLGIKFIFVAVSLFFVLHGIYLLQKIGIVGEKVSFYKNALGKNLPQISKQEFAAAWEAIKARMSAMREAEWKLAVIEADKLCDLALKRAGYKGKDMGARLKRITPKEFSGLDDLWKAHKMRNLLSHDMDYHISFSEAQWAVEVYGEALKALGVLD